MMSLEIEKDIFFTRDGLLDKLLDNTFDRSIIVDQTGHIIFFSESSRRESGKTSEEVLGRYIGEFVSNDGFERVLRSGKSEKTLTILEGQLAVASHFPVFDQGELLGVIGIVYFNNINAVKKLMIDATTLSNKEYLDLYHSLSRNVTAYTFDDYIGKSKVVQELIAKTKQAASSKLPILFIGETGTGKEILANAVHHSNKATFMNPFVKINCSAIPSELLESELFGHEKGAFTGANTLKRGKFETANNGSILLDEIGDMSFAMQTKLLRVLEEKEFERVGGNKLIPTNARVIAATNLDLNLLSQEKKFRTDLYYRLNTLEIRVPSLRERVEDIPLLIDYFINHNNLTINFSKEAIACMMDYHWPGNVRQLRNMINRFNVLNQGDIIGAKDVYPIIDKDRKEDLSFINSKHNKIAYQSLAQMEIDYIRQVLNTCHGNKSKCAAMLEISRSTLNRKLAHYDIKS